jgi:hypothetical protein
MMKLSSSFVDGGTRARSLSQKLGIFKRVLRQSHLSFILLVKLGLKIQTGDVIRKAKKLLDLISDITN